MTSRRWTAPRSLAVPLLAGAVAAGLAGCGSDAAGSTAGTLTADDLPGSVTVTAVRHDDQAGQVNCQAVNDAEDEALLVASDSYPADQSDAVALDLAGGHHESVASLSMRVPDAGAAVAQVVKGARACVRSAPDHYRLLRSIPGRPKAVGYTAREDKPTPVFTRRILVPLHGRVVVVSVTRSGDDHFTVRPESLLGTAVRKARQAD